MQVPMDSTVRNSSRSPLPAPHTHQPGQQLGKSSPQPAALVPRSWTHNSVRSMAPRPPLQAEPLSCSPAPCCSPRQAAPPSQSAPPAHLPPCGSTCGSHPPPSACRSRGCVGTRQGLRPRPTRLPPSLQSGLPTVLLVTSPGSLTCARSTPSLAQLPWMPGPAVPAEGG